MATEVLMPQMGESIAEGTITKWLVGVGEPIERDQPLLEISTDKVDAEIPSPAAGTLLEQRRQEGETVPVNEIVGLIGEPGEEPAVAPEPAGRVVEREAEENRSAEEEGSDVPGELTLEQRIRRFSSPVVRKIAAEHGVDISRLEGSGLHGRVTKKDILAYLEGRPEREAPPPPAAPRPAAPARAPGEFHVPAYGSGDEVEIVPMSRIRQITAAHMVYSKATSAHVTTVFHVDMTRVAELRRRAKGRFLREHGTKLTYMPFIFSATARAIQRHPQLNASVDGTDIVYKKAINLGMAVAMDRGLLVPVLKDAHELSLVGLAKAANDLADRARSKKLLPEETQGGTFTVTNPGVFGSLFGTPIINQPQVAILGIGTIEKRPVVRADAEGLDVLAIRTMSYFALTFDHRLIDGADADRFMVDIKTTLEEGDWGELAGYL